MQLLDEKDQNITYFYDPVASLTAEDRGMRPPRHPEAPLAFFGLWGHLANTALVRKSLCVGRNAREADGDAGRSMC